MAVLEVEGLCFRYGKRPALRDIDLSIGPGEVVGLVGPNGSGKSTLLKCANGILRPHKGRVALCGDDLGRLTPREVARLVGYVPQSFPELYSASVFDAVFMGRVPHLRWRSSERDIRITSEVMRSLGIMRFAMHDIARLSGGERQKVVIARALVQEPRLLLLDEPTANLDLRHQLEVMEIVRREARKGTSALISVHDLNLALRHCGRFLMLKNGRIFAAGGREVFTPKNLKAVYGIGASVVENAGRTLIVPDLGAVEAMGRRDGASEGPGPAPAAVPEGVDPR